MCFWTLTSPSHRAEVSVAELATAVSLASTLTHRLAPARTSPGWGFSLCGSQVACSPSGLREKDPMESHAKRTFLPRLFTTCCPQQIRDKFAVGIKRRTVGAAGDLPIGGRFRSGFASDNLIKRVAVGALEKRISTGLAMISPSSSMLPFSTCGAEYKIVRVEAKMTIPEGGLTCRKCGGPLHAREGRYVLK